MRQTLSSDQSRLAPDQLGRLPVCTVLGGPNGSGKSSVVASLTLPGVFVNTDLVAREMDPENPERVSIAAGKHVLQELDRLLRSRSDFIYETTLSSRQSLALMDQARKAGYRVNLVFIALESVALNIRRVAERVMRGGHNIPEAVIRRRYESAFERLATAIKLADSVVILENSESGGPTLIAQVISGVIAANNLDPVSDLHSRVAASLATGLSLPITTILPAS